MKKHGSRKLALHRETLASLQPDVLANVAGGAIGGTQSLLHCPTLPPARTCLLCIPDDPK